MENVIEREIGWDDEIEKESSFILLPEGDYNFVVESLERGRYEGSDKLPPCNMAILTLIFQDPESGEEVRLKHRLFLHSKTEGMLSAFFCAIGQKKHGEKCRMNWNMVVGARGKCKVSIRKWKNKDGEEIQSNDIKKFYDPEESTPVQPVYQAAQQGTYQAPVQPVQMPSQYQQAPQGAFTPGKF